MPEKLWFWLFWDKTIISLVFRIQRTRFYFVMAVYVENYGIFKIIIETKAQSNNHTTLSTCVIKQQQLRTKQVLFQEKGNNCRNIEQDLSLSFFFLIFSLITLACTIYIWHCISFVYDYLGRAPVLWCNWSQWTAQFSMSTTTSRESWRGGGDTAPLSRPVQDRVETSQANINWVPESFFTSTGEKKPNKWRTPEK